MNNKIRFEISRLKKKSFIKDNNRWESSFEKNIWLKTNKWILNFDLKKAILLKSIDNNSDSKSSLVKNES